MQKHFYSILFHGNSSYHSLVLSSDMCHGHQVSANSPAQTAKAFFYFSIYFYLHLESLFYSLQQSTHIFSCLKPQRWRNKHVCHLLAWSIRTQLQVFTAASHVCSPTLHWKNPQWSPASLLVSQSYSLYSRVELTSRKFLSNVQIVDPQQGRK